MADRHATALVIGATADIGRTIARRLADEGWTLQLAARDETRLEREAQNLRVRTGVTVTSHRCDVLRDDGGASVLNALNPLPDIAVCVVGLLGDQAENQRNPATAERVMRTNYVGPVLLMGTLAERFEQRGGGVLVGVSSVAGDRGRAADYSLRLGQGEGYGVPVWAAESAGRDRRPRCDRQARVRAYAYDRRDEPAGRTDCGARRGGRCGRQGDSPTTRCRVRASRLATCHAGSRRRPGTLFQTAQRVRNIAFRPGSEKA